MIKHQNQQKIESHKWFFKGFCETMNPKYTQIIDCGSIPLWNSISYMIMHMDNYTNIGGCCGEIECILNEKKDNGTAISFFESVILRAQYVEYKISHYLDKASESLFGFVSVLPGAFSLFRWKCIKDGPLNEFLKGAKDDFADIGNTKNIMSCADANKYLAEDRIMCLEIIAKKDNNYIIEYIPGAKCLTDPPLSLTNLIKQRRRWFNGSLFATFHVLYNIVKIRKRSNSFFRNMFFSVLYIFMLAQTLLSQIIVGSFYASFSIFLRSILPSENCLSVTSAANVIENDYLTFLFFIIMLSTTVIISWAETGFRICSIVMGLFTLLMISCSIIYAYQQQLNSLTVIFFGVYALTYFIPLILNWSKLKVSDFLKGIVYSTFLSPTYINIFTIYSISNIDDISWGSRPAVNTVSDNSFKAAENFKSQKYKNFRSNFIVFWLVINLICGFVITYLSRNGQNIILFVIACVITSVNVTKLVLSFFHQLQTVCNRISTKSYIKKISKENKIFYHDRNKTMITDDDVFISFFDEETNNHYDPKNRNDKFKKDYHDESKIYFGLKTMKVVKRLNTTANEQTKLSASGRLSGQQTYNEASDSRLTIPKTKFEKKSQLNPMDTEKISSEFEAESSLPNDEEKEDEINNVHKVNTQEDVTNTSIVFNGLNTQSKILPRISLGSLYDKQKEAIKCVEDSEEEDDGQVNVNFQNESIKGDKSTNEPASENKFSFYNFDKKNTSNDEIDESDDGDDESSHELYSKKIGGQTNNKSQMSNKTEKPKKSVNFSDSLKPSNSASNNKKLLNDYPVKNNYVHKQADEDSEGESDND